MNLLMDYEQFRMHEEKMKMAQENAKHETRMVGGAQAGILGTADQYANMGPSVGTGPSTVGNQVQELIEVLSHATHLVHAICQELASLKKRI